MLEWLRLRLRALFRKNEVENELDEELRAHLERQIDQNLQQGMNSEEARAAARRDFGGIDQAKEECRDARGVRILEEIRQDLRYGLRMLVKGPGFTLVVVITLALGIGANTAILSVLNAVLLRPLPYHDANRLVALRYTNARSEELGLDPATYLHIKKNNTVFTDLSAWVNGLSTWPANLTGKGEPEKLQGFRVSANLFRTLGVTAAIGRTFLDGEDRLGNNHVVVISHNLWQRRFGGNPEIIGRPILLNGTPWNVVGVMPADFRLIIKTDVWTPLALTPDEEHEQSALYLHQFARLKPGVSIEQARQEVEKLARHFRNTPNLDLRANLPLMQSLLMGMYGQELFIQLAAVGFILLIACANVANMLLARASVRRKEMAVRLALGARRWRIVRQLMVESAMLAVMGGACGLALAGWLIPILVNGLHESVAAKNNHVATLRLDTYALGFTFALSLITTVLFGLVPALQASKVNLNDALKEGSRSDAQGQGQYRLRSLLVVTEVALTLTLLIGAGLMSKSFWRLSHANPGFEPAGVLTAKIDPSGDKYCEPQQFVDFYQQLLDRVSAIPEIEQAGLKNSWDHGWRIVIEEHPAVPEELRPWVGRNQVSADYFRAMGIPLRAGRFFTDRDVRGAAPVVIIDETLQRRHFPNEQPIGRHLRFEDGLREIVGVVGTTRAWHRFSPGRAEDYPRLYSPYQQENWRSMFLIVRARSSDPESLIPAIRRALAATDKDQPISDFKTLAQSASELNADQGFLTLLTTAFAVLAALMAAGGIYGVMSYAVTQRTHEIGVRMALGAQAGDVEKLIVRQGLLLVLAGIVIGLAGAFVLTRVMANLLYGVSAADPITFVSMPLFLAVVGLLASYLPARRATKVDPLTALRAE